MTDLPVHPIEATKIAKLKLRLNKPRKTYKQLLIEEGVKFDKNGIFSFNILINNIYL